MKIGATIRSYSHGLTLHTATVCAVFVHKKNLAKNYSFYLKIFKKFERFHNAEIENSYDTKMR